MTPLAFDLQDATADLCDEVCCSQIVGEMLRHRCFVIGSCLAAPTFASEIAQEWLVVNDQSCGIIARLQHFVSERCPALGTVPHSGIASANEQRSGGTRERPTETLNLSGPQRTIWNVLRICKIVAAPIHSQAMWINPVFLEMGRFVLVGLDVSNEIAELAA